MSSSHQQDLSSSSPDILPDVPSPLLAVETEAGIVTPSPEEIEEILRKQNSRRVTAFEAAKLEKEAKKNWDIFYKRNETRFFKDRHWTLREFQEILEWRQQQEQSQSASDNKEVNLQQDGGGRGGPILLEVGCGCGNFIIPLLEEIPLLRAYACDFSPRAVDFVKSHAGYNESKIKAFVCDLTEDDCFRVLETEADLRFRPNRTDPTEKVTLVVDDVPPKVNFVSMIFVLSAISPAKHLKVIENLGKVVKPGGIVFFRDYGRFDMAQLRFKGGNKIDENFYVRRDKTRAYYFTPEEIEQLFTGFGTFSKIQCEYVHRRTVNVKESVDVGRIFVQGKFIKNK